MPATIRGRLALISTPTPFRKRHTRLVLIDRGRFFAFYNFRYVTSVCAKNRIPKTTFKGLKSRVKLGLCVRSRAAILPSNLYIDFCLIVMCFFFIDARACSFQHAMYTMHLMHLNLTA